MHRCAFASSRVLFVNECPEAKYLHGSNRICSGGDGLGFESEILRD